MEQQTSIYLITNTANGKIYVGRTRSTILLRWKRHCWQSRKGNTYLGRAIQKYGASSFKHELLELVKHEEANAREIYWIHKLDALNHSVGYNLNWQSSGASDVGDSTRVRLGKASRSWWASMTAEERTAILSKRMTGRQFSSAHKNNLAKAKSGKSPSVKKTSRYVGVSLCRNRGVGYWRAMCYDSSKQYDRYCGSEKEAAQCYDRLALALRGPNATINFPSKRKSYLKEDLQAFLNHIKVPTSHYMYVSFNTKKQKWGVCYRRKFYGTTYATELEAAAAASLCSGLTLNQLNRGILS